MNPIISSFVIYITIFLFGMTVMRIGLKSVAGEHIERWIRKFTDHPIKGLIVGIIATMLIQSSSAVLVLAIGLTAAGMMKFHQTIGLILGANIGTTITGEIATIDIAYSHLVLLFLGVILILLPNQTLFSLGTISFGLGCLFTAMLGFNSLASPLKELVSVNTVLTLSNTFPLIAILVGTIFTSIIQSSSAATVITMGFMNEQLLSLHSAIAILLGANIGTCVTALIASIGTNWQSRWTAYTHVMFNVAGVILFYPFITHLANAAMYLANAPDVQLAHATVIFNTLSALVALPFATRIGKWVELRHAK